MTTFKTASCSLRTDCREGGTKIDDSIGQSEKAPGPTRESLEGDSNATRESPSDSKKQFSPMTSTEGGIQSDASDEQAENADASIRASLESDSNVTRESLVQ
jgi:hypothetical protein